jgi:hypothetical protein
MSLRLSICLGSSIRVCLKPDEAGAYEKIIPFYSIFLEQAPPGNWKILKLKLHGFAVDSLTMQQSWKILPESSIAKQSGSFGLQSGPLIYRRPQMT